MLIALYIELVWRLSEFAFLCGYFGSRTFCFMERNCEKEKNQLCPHNMVADKNLSGSNVAEQNKSKI